jgi:xanthine dehydrogenase YagS FAD-binding subunit
VRPFEYVLAESVEGAVRAVDEVEGARFLGGGTNLVDHMKLGIAEPTRLVDVSRLENRSVTASADGVRIGAAARNGDVAVDETIRERYPALSLALLSGASGQLRNMATVGGNLLQRTRCRYFQDVTMPCNKRHPGSGCPAITGEHHNLAILGASERCVATHPSDMAVSMVALDATLSVVDRDGSTTLSVDDLYDSPAEDPMRDTVLARSALITEVVLDNSTVGWRSTYRKVRERASYAFAIASVAAAISIEGGDVRGVRIGIGGVAHRPWRARRAEQVLLGGPANDDAFRHAITAELEAAVPLRDNGYKVPLLANVVTSVLHGLAESG